MFTRPTPPSGRVRGLRKAILVKDKIEEADGLDDAGLAAGLLRFLSETRPRGDLLVLTQRPATAATDEQLREMSLLY